MSDYRELKVYEKSYEAAKMVYIISKGMPQSEQFGLTSQIRRASTSVPLNIAEGYGKQAGDKEVLRFLQMARGSSVEMQVLVNMLKDFGYISDEVYKETINQYEEIGKMISGLMKSIKLKTSD